MYDTRNKKINISNNNKVIKLLYIDDLIEDFIKRIKLKKWNKFIKILYIFINKIIEWHPF